MEKHYDGGHYPWVPDRGDGTYANPVLYADYSDPDVIRVGDFYYLTASSFNQSPGLPVLRSSDLVNWTIISYAVSQPPGERYRQVQPGCGIWAPAIRHHGGKFWIFFPMPDEGIFVTTTEKAEGPWCEPWLLQGGKGLIDPCPLWEEDGTAWLIFAYAGSRCGMKHKLHVRPMGPDGRALTGPGQIVFDGTEDHPTLEGPKFHKFGEYYYISAPAGGVPHGWQVILRSRNVYGPYDESRIVLEQNGSPVNGPHQGALVEDVEGEWWFLHFQEHQPYGRICHLQPVVWRDGWPMMGEERGPALSGKPVLTHKKPAGKSEVLIPQTSDDFEGETLGLPWAFQGAAGKELFSLTERRGFLRLHAGHEGVSDLFTAPHVIVQKTPAPRFMVETEMEFHPGEDGLEAGLAILGLFSAALVVTRNAGETSIALRLGGELVMKKKLPGSPVVFVLRFEQGGYCQFGVREEGDLQWFGPSFLAREGKWIGSRIGLFCSSYGPLALDGHADFSCFRFLSLPE